MRKRLLSLILGCIMLWCCMVPALTGCNGSTPENKYTVAEWLSKVEESFNMLYYTQAEPQIQTVRSDSEYYDVVQIAAEWGLISAEDGLDFDKPVTKEFCADTLAKATNFKMGETFDGIADADSITDTYVDGVNLALNEGIFKLDDSGKFDPKYEPTKEEADVAMVAARNAWTNFSFGGECYDKSIVKENVINLGGINSENSPVVNSSYKVDYSGDLNVIGPDGEYQDNSKKTITFDAGQAPAMQVGTVLALPGDNVAPMNYAVVVDSITENADGSVTVNTHNATAGEVYDQMIVRQSGKVDFSDAKFILPDGEIIGASSPAAAPMSNVGVNNRLSTREGRYVFADKPQKAVLADPKMNTKELADGLSVSFGVSDDTLAFSIHAEVEIDGIKYEVEFSESKTFNIEEDIDVEWFIVPVGLNSIYLALDIDTTEQLMLKVSGSTEVDFTPAKDTLEPDDIKKVYEQLSDQLKKVQKGGSTLKDICSVQLFEVVIPNTFLHFTVKLAVTFEGTLTFTVEKHEKYGVEYVNDTIRFIDENSEERTISFDGKIEAVLKLILSVEILDYPIVDLGVEGGVGLAVSSKVYLKNPTTQAIEAEFALPKGIMSSGGSSKLEGSLSVSGVGLSHPEIESCLEVKAYPIVRLFACSGGTFANDFLGLSYNQEILGEDDAFATIHYEGGKGIVDTCSHENAGDNVDIEVGNTVTTNYDKYLLSKGEISNGLKLLTIPEGINLRDVQITSSDPSVVLATNAVQLNEMIQKLSIISNSDNKKIYYKEYSKVDVDHFQLIGVADGVATLTINAGGKTCQVEVIVGNGGIAEVSEGRFVIENTSINLKPGETGKVEVKSAPGGYTLADATFSTTDAEVATVDQNGNVTAGSKTGSAVIYITTNDGLFTGACIINVS